MQTTSIIKMTEGVQREYNEHLSRIANMSPEEIRANMKRNKRAKMLNTAKIVFAFIALLALLLFILWR